MATKTKKTSKPSENEADNGTVNSDWYNTDVSDVDISFPLLREDPVAGEFASWKEVPWKNGSGTSGLLTCKTTEKTRDLDGKTVNVGYSITRRINLTVTPDRSADDVRKDIARDVQAFGKKRLSDLRPGDPVLIRPRNSKQRTDEKTGITYEPRTEIGSLRKLKV
jgi:hypothetical protein